MHNLGIYFGFCSLVPNPVTSESARSARPLPRITSQTVTFFQHCASPRTDIKLIKIHTNKI